MGEVVQMMPTVPCLPWEESLEWFRKLSTEQLKRMWDADEYHIHCDEIYFVMNERGEGAYVAV